MNIENSYNIVWIRQDLRTHDHSSFHEAINENNKILPVFIFDQEILKRFQNKEDRRLSFIADALVAINKTLAEYDGKLLILYGKGSEVIAKLASILNIKKIFASADYEVETRSRDEKIKIALSKENIDFILLHDHVLTSPEEITKKDNTPYKVYTPYKKIWKLTVNPIHYLEKKVNFSKGNFVNIDEIKNIIINNGISFIKCGEPASILDAINYNYVKDKYWKIDDAKKRLSLFMSSKIQDYKIERNFMGNDGTSRLSPYIRFGIISVRECYRKALEKDGWDWINELIWRDFYKMILYFFPKTYNTEFKLKYQNTIIWENNDEVLYKWKNGMTGFPLIDAAMRQLKTMGWMHNRMRMLTASFLSKSLLIDWRIGEEHFAQYLMDYDMASNVGGWQWCASTGTDAQPYFRVFNPISQSKEYDSQGKYIKKYVKELAKISNKFIHEPKKYDSKLKYPDPIIDVKMSRQRFITMFKSIGNKSNE